MNKYIPYPSNYNKQPFIADCGEQKDCKLGWQQIANQLQQDILLQNKKKTVIAVECYTGVFEDEIISAFTNLLQPQMMIVSSAAMKTEEEINTMIFPDVTNDRIFGYITRLQINDFFDKEKLAAAKQTIQQQSEGLIVIIGAGASLFADECLLLYADMPRWEGQLRFRRNEVSNLGCNNRQTEAALQYKQAFFVDWRVCDKLKKQLMHKWDYIVDTTHAEQPKMISGKLFHSAMQKTVQGPFRVVPFFDPGPWGGQWMKEVCELDKTQSNFAWCFDCVPEENSLLLQFGNTLFETPSINLVFTMPRQLLGESVQARFGDEFPIRFDFLDTMDGGNLSLQVHPYTEYIREHFGMDYTQDESYYILDAAGDACVYLGLKEKTDFPQLITELKEAQVSGNFDAEKFVDKWPVKKHDHVLIPAGTIHCSGSNSMVLEISATPYIFTFKLWDWGRMGLDGKPRPINIQHGEKVINQNCTTSFTKQNLINAIEKIAEGDGWTEEKTGLHEREFIETRRHWFTKKVTHNTNGIVNVLNLLEGREAIIESPSGAFKPFVVHYAETFIVPAMAGEYTITPYGESENKTCATIKAFVRTKA